MNVNWFCFEFTGFYWNPFKFNFLPSITNPAIIKLIKFWSLIFIFSNETYKYKYLNLLLNWLNSSINMFRIDLLQFFILKANFNWFNSFNRGNFFDRKQLVDDYIINFHFLLLLFCPSFSINEPILIPD